MVEEVYTCLHDVFGSDHRPVNRIITIKNFKQPKFAEVHKLLDTNNAIQGYGMFDIDLVDIRILDLGRIGKLTKFDFSDVTKPLQLRVSFYNSALDTSTSPIVFSQEQLAPANANEIQVDPWTSERLPCLYTAFNTFSLASQSRLMMFIWACGPAEHFPNEEMLLGQVNIKMREL